MPLQREYWYLLFRFYGHSQKQIKEVLRKPRIWSIQEILIKTVSNQLAPFAIELKTKEAEEETNLEMP